MFILSIKQTRNNVLQTGMLYIGLAKHGHSAPGHPAQRRCSDRYRGRWMVTDAYSTPRQTKGVQGTASHINSIQNREQCNERLSGPAFKHQAHKGKSSAAQTFVSV